MRGEYEEVQPRIYIPSISQTGLANFFSEELSQKFEKVSKI